MTSIAHRLSPREARRTVHFVVHILDVKIFYDIFSFVDRHPFMHGVAVYFAVYLIFVMVGVGLWLMARDRHFRGKGSRYILSSVVVAYAINMAIGIVRFRARPPEALPEIEPLITGLLTQKSFPSGHATLAFALAASIYYLDKRWGIVFIILAGFVAMGRVMVGVHFPLDVLAGAALGFITAMVLRAHN